MRELVMVAIAVLLVYLLWLVVRWLILSRKARASLPEVTQFREPMLNSVILPPESDTPRQASSHSAHIDTLADDDEDEDAPDALPSATYDKPRPPAEPDASAFGFDALLEVRQSRHLVDTMQREVNLLKHEVQQLRQELADLRAASRVSPQYGEAVSLARRGLDASAIAERCGISVAEAELVRSLLAMSPSGD